MNTFARIALLLATPVIGALVGAPLAEASPESDFCRKMAAVGFTSDCVTLTTLAKEVCAQFDRGLDLNSVVQRLDLATKNQNLSNYIMAGASLYFCPNHAS